MRVYALVVLLACAAPSVALAQDSPAAATPSPSPAPSAIPRFSISGSGSNVFVNQSVSGPGITPPEAAAFQSGSPLSPTSPYDWFSSAPMTPGIDGTLQYMFTGSLHMGTSMLDTTIGGTGIAGDKTTAAYWGESLLGNASPHLNHFFNPGITFPGKTGTNDIVGGVLALPYRASLRADDDSWHVTGGYFDLTQTDRFVFAAPPVTNVAPSVGVQTAETLGPGSPNLDAWSPSSATLPLLGVDLFRKYHSASLEVSDALLPSLADTSVRALNESLVIDRGDYGRFSAEVSNIRTNGAPVSTTTFFGVDQTFLPGPQGRLFTSTLADQHQTVYGLRGFFHPMKGDDVLVELGRSTYHAGLVVMPGSSKPGNYEHFALTRHFDKNTDAGVDSYRFDPRYATILMPYGVPENVWSVAWSWPGQWLKSNYQSVDNSIIGINREGFRVHADATRGRLELHAATDAWREIEPITAANASQEGWVDGYFLPQLDGQGTLGWQRQAALYAAWHFDRDDFAIDSVWDRSYRPIAGDALDFVSINYPQIVASWQHHFNKNALAVVGYGRYSSNGTWGTTPVADIYGVGFIGAQWSFSNRQQLLVQLRHAGLTGVPSIPLGPQVTMQGTTLIVDHRITF